MRIYVPRAVYVTNKSYYLRDWTGSDPFHPDPHEKVRLCNAVCTPSNTKVIEVTPFFYDTEGRDINDCCHAKVVSEGKDCMPLLDVLDCKYTSQFTGYDGQSTWEQNPYVLPGGRTTRGTRSRRIFNEGSFSIYVASDTGCYRSNSTLTFNINVYGRVLKSGSYQNMKLERQLYMYFAGHEGKSGVTPYYPVWMTWRSEYRNGYRWNGNLPSGYSSPSSLYSTIANAYEGITCSYRSSSRFYFYPDPNSHFETILSALEAEARRWIRWGLDHNFSGWTSYSGNAGTVSYHPTNPRDFFVLQEPEIVVEGLDPLVLSNHGIPHYWRNVLVQQAYLDAVDHMPRLNDNSISNILEIAGFIVDLVINHKISMPESLSDAWLAYRYTYTTTKLDAEEAISFVHRNIQLGSLSKWITCYGESHCDYTVDGKITPIDCRCSFHIRPRDVEVLMRIWRALYTYGLQPNFYVVWDMIPYSFIVDWLLPIGKVAHAVDAYSNVTEVTYEIKDVCFSLKYYNDDVYGNKYCLYTRWSQEIPQLNGFYFLEEDPISTKVKGMRILDSLSLIIGRR